ncbi:MAG TPA: creatininase family protein [Chitinispirillaceae bacterium]|nr:creatininase family protein [Chitinispirillaceae bacterium]
MDQQEQSEKQARITLLSTTEIENYLHNNQSLIIPLGGLEPFGCIGAIGIPGMCSDSLAVELAVQCGSLVAPMLPYASSPLFKAFHGCVSMGSSGYEVILSSICNSFIYQGFKKILLLQSSLMPDDALGLVLKRVKNSRNSGDVQLYNWQVDQRILTFLKKESGAESFERLEQAQIHLATYINKEYIRSDDFAGGGSQVTSQQYKTWKKRGADPHKYRKLFPSGISAKIGSGNLSSDLGKRLFQYILECMIKDYSEFLKAGAADAAQ